MQKDYWEQRIKRHGDNLKSVMHHPTDSDIQLKDLRDFFTDLEVDINSVLDYGCGVGRLYNTLGKLFNNYTGIDISEGMIKEAKKQHPGGAFNLFNDYKYMPSADMIVCFTVLLHLPPADLDEFCKNARNKFKYIFIGQHMDEEIARRRLSGQKRSSHCFNLPESAYINKLSIKKIIKKVDYNSYYGDTKLTYLLGEL